MKRKQKAYKYVIGLLVFILLLENMFILLMHIITSEVEIPIPASPYPVYKTKVFMPDALSGTYIGMSIDEFKKVKKDVSFEDCEPGSCSQYRSNPIARLKIPQRDPYGLKSFTVNFVNGRSPNEWTSLASIEAFSDGEMTEDDRRKAMLKQISNLTKKTGSNPLKGLWIDKMAGKEFLQPSLLWRNDYADIVLFISIDDSSKYSYRMGIYDNSFFKACIGCFLCEENSCMISKAGWTTDNKKLETTFRLSKLTTIDGIDKYKWFIPQDISCIKY